MRFEEPTKWELFLDGFHSFWYALDSYDTVEHFPDDFWEALSYGWMQIYIYPYDDAYNPTISHVRQLRLGAKPYIHTVYVSEEVYDKLVEAINSPPDPEATEKLRKLFERTPPWDEEND